MSVSWPRVDSPELLHPQRSDAGAWQVVCDSGRPVRHTVVVPFSRPWALQQWAERWAWVALPPGTECVAIVDHDDPVFFAKVADALRSIRGLESIRIHCTHLPPLGEWDDIEARRARICGHWHRFLGEARGDIILGAEDDTLPDWDAYLTLTRHIEQPGCVFAQGTIIGRWDCGIVPHWQAVPNVHGRVVTWISGSYYGSQTVTIHGGGWYCFAAKKDALCSIEWTWPAGPVGPDVWTVYQLSRLGHCIGDWGVQCDHIAQSMSLSPNRTIIDRVNFRLQDGRWRRQVEAGKGWVHPDRPVQIAGTQPRPLDTRKMRPVRSVTLFGDGTSEDLSGFDLLRKLAEGL